MRTAAVKLAKQHFGCEHVTAVCQHEEHRARALAGCRRGRDYLQEDFTNRGETYDVVLDAVGKHSLYRSRRALRPGGLYFATDRLYNFPLALLTKWFGKRKVVFTVERPTREDLLLLRELMEAGKYRAVIDRTYPLEDVVEATEYVESFQKTGNVVLTIPHEEEEDA